MKQFKIMKTIISRETCCFGSFISDRQSPDLNAPRVAPLLAAYELMRFPKFSKVSAFFRELSSAGSVRVVRASRMTVDRRELRSPCKMVPQCKLKLEKAKD